MSATWFSSDTHFLHAMVAKLRGFTSSAEHDETVIYRWNHLVRPDDLVWHLGDAGLGNETRVLEQAARLNGRKHLITGNHDPCWPGHRSARSHQRKWLEVFESVQAFAKTRIDGTTVLLSHMPYLGAGDHTPEERHTQFRLHDEGGWLVHGHTHQSGRNDGRRSVHAGLDAWDLRPAGEGEILDAFRECEEWRWREVTARRAATGPALR